ncbi:DUF1223 domain-containing protein [Hymenobacter negativus]|uniref:DUF1223 domain-containing protein n=1 Tax=Hymenobacter negativus TaxID=2795026 RepID=A0ABS0Q650_9BACT|nr:MULTISPECIES: DUF1223 domain-containing protein [Bacteria]MBH8558070.1 DUF1223 domain-containing protein [Hymenobacter negativus]MBH8568561.1 DUF1223 domain-containing protein [Hymenobacter negativus]MBR7208295.1 DUF1223 domain-containing protein [Microvirga sp. STS02]
MKALIWLFAIPLVSGGAALGPTLPTTPASGVSRVPVIVELFTSEGCSSCPAADAALRQLEKAQSVPGAEVIVLGEHVDYWNRLGWKDAFSAPSYTERQRQYAKGFGTGSYTPQAVVNGRYELVGSRTADLAAAVAKAAKAPQAAVAVALAGSMATVRVSSLPPGTPAAEVLLAITESGLSSQIGRGENSGLLLHHAAVVRQLLPLGRVGADGTFAASPALKLAAEWKRPNLRAVVLVQELASHRIVGAATAAVGN